MLHNFPAPHTDVIEQFIDYQAPAEKLGGLAAYDGSVIVERTKGEVSARCDMEAANILARLRAGTREPSHPRRRVGESGGTETVGPPR